jgi:hypothetical protein
MRRRKWNNSHPLEFMDMELSFRNTEEALATFGAKYGSSRRAVYSMLKSFGLTRMRDRKGAPGLTDRAGLLMAEADDPRLTIGVAERFILGVASDEEVTWVPPNEVRQLHMERQSRAIGLFLGMAASDARISAHKMWLNTGVRRTVIGALLRGSPDSKVSTLLTVCQFLGVRVEFYDREGRAFDPMLRAHVEHVIAEARERSKEQG